MAVERTNTKISLEGAHPISDYEKKLRSVGFVQRVYRKDLEAYVANNVNDPIIKERVFAEIAKYPCQAISQMAKRIDQLILKIESKVNKERSKIQGEIKLPEIQNTNLDISDLYDSITNVNEVKVEDNNENTVKTNEQNNLEEENDEAL